MSIEVLSPEVASKIAAGEVVERPASVIKELLDNSIDAGATRINVEIQAGGVRLMRVVDNGKGIPPEQVPVAFERFATSKVSSIDDLETISTMGFRGEALPSIAAVSEVTMVTRCTDDLAGTFISIKDGQIIEKNKRGGPAGTTVTVRNLFRSVPARLKFLKTTARENGHISQIVSQYSLAFPEVGFTLVIDGRTAFNSPGRGNLREVLGQVYGLDNAREMLEVVAGADDENILNTQVTGLVSPPSLTRATRSYISFFVNRRWVQSRMLTYALQEAYHGLLLAGRYPIAVIKIDMPAQELDVNVHPAKSEVKFRHEREVFTALRNTVRSSLISGSPMPEMETPSPAHPDAAKSPEQLPVFDSGTDIEGPVMKPPVAVAREGSIPTPSLPVLRVIGQVGNTYIVAEGPDGMYLVDQHAAHERILFEKILEQRKRQSVEVQGMLQPVTVELTVRQQELLEQHSETLTVYGFEIERFGDRTCLVRAVPAMLQRKDTVHTLTGLLDFLGEGVDRDWEEEIAISLACHGAVLAGQTLTHEEMRDLIRQLEATSQPRSCPHGRPTMVHLSASQLEKGFGRR